MELDKTDNRRSVRIRQGQPITIRLPENPTTGYRWIVASAQESLVALLSDTYQAIGINPGMSGVHSFHFQAMKPGCAIVELVNRRAWEKEGASLEHFTITVEIVK